MGQIPLHVEREVLVQVIAACLRSTLGIVDVRLHAFDRGAEGLCPVLKYADVCLQLLYTGKVLFERFNCLIGLCSKLIET